MNIIAIDIGNTNVGIGLFLDGEQQFIESVSGEDHERLRCVLRSGWEKVPVSRASKENKRDGVIVACSVKPVWTDRVGQIVRDDLREKLRVVGTDIPLPMPVWVDEPSRVGADRVLSAAAAYAVVEHAVVVADFGTAVTVDLVDDNGVFQGGAIFPGFELGAMSLHEHTAQLPKITVTRPTEPLGRTTRDAINCGLYYSAIGALEEIVRRYAEKIGTWPQTVITGSGADLIKEDCPFVDSIVPHLVVKGIVLAYQKYLDERNELS